MLSYFWETIDQIQERTGASEEEIRGEISKGFKEKKVNFKHLKEGLYFRLLKWKF